MSFVRLEGNLPGGARPRSTGVEALRTAAPLPKKMMLGEKSGSALLIFLKMKFPESTSEQGCHIMILAKAPISFPQEGRHFL